MSSRHWRHRRRRKQHAGIGDSGRHADAGVDVAGGGGSDAAQVPVGVVHRSQGPGRG